MVSLLGFVLLLPRIFSSGISLLMRSVGISRRWGWIRHSLQSSHSIFLSFFLSFFIYISSLNENTLHVPYHPWTLSTYRSPGCSYGRIDTYPCIYVRHSKRQVLWLTSSVGGTLNWAAQRRRSLLAAGDIRVKNEETWKSFCPCLHQTFRSLLLRDLPLFF